MIEHDLRRDTRVRAAKNDSKRMLTFCQLLAPLCHVRIDQASIFIAVGCQPCSFVDRLMWMLRFAFGVTFIALFEPGDRFSWRNDWLVGVIRIGGADKLVVTSETNQNQKQRDARLCHNVLSSCSLKTIGWFWKMAQMKNKISYCYR